MKKLLCIVYILTSIQVGYAAIAFDATSTANITSTSLTYSHTTSGSNRGLVVVASVASSRNLTVTYAGVSMTLVNVVTDSTSNKTYMWYLTNPASGANNIVVTVTGGSSFVGSSGISFTGVDQTNMFEASSTNAESGSSASYNSTITSINDGAFQVSTSRTGSGFTLTGGANTSVAVQPELVGLGSGAIWYSTTGKTPAGAVTLNVTCTAQFFGGAITMSIKPAGGGVVSPTTLGFWKFFKIGH